MASAETEGIMNGRQRGEDIVLRRQCGTDSHRQIAENKGDLQILLYQFYKAAKNVDIEAEVGRRAATATRTVACLKNIEKPIHGSRSKILYP